MKKKQKKIQGIHCVLLLLLCVSNIKYYVVTPTSKINLVLWLIFLLTEAETFICMPKGKKLKKKKIENSRAKKSNFRQFCTAHIQTVLNVFLVIKKRHTYFGAYYPFQSLCKCVYSVEKSNLRESCTTILCFTLF